MSVYLLENHSFSSNFSNHGDKYGGRADLIFKDKTFFATGNRGVISGKHFPWTVLHSVSSANVLSHVGFNLHISITATKPAQYNRDPGIIGVKLQGDFLPILKHVFDEVPNTVGVNLDVLFKFGSSHDGSSSFHVLASEAITDGKNFSVNTTMSEHVLDRLLYKHHNEPSVCVTIEVFGKDWAPACLKRLTLPSTPLFHDDIRTRNLNKKLLKEKVLSDFTLVADNGFEIPCHKAILQLSSPFFERMFQTECREMKENRCQLSLSQDGLKALLEFLYFSGIEAPAENSGVAMELLEISHELQIPELEIKMKEFLIGQPDEELDLDGALQLFLRCTKLDLDGYDDMKEKAMNVIKKKKKELRKSSVFSELMKTNQEFGMEFFSFFI